MAISSTHITCDVCGRPKGDTNHWFKAISALDTSNPANIGIAFGPSTASISDPEGLVIEDICGDACAHKRLSRWIASLNHPSPNPEESEQI
jgi:hypothetical protein